MTTPRRKLRLHGRRASAVAAMSLSALLLISCGPDDEEETPTAEAPAAETEEATQEAQGGLESPETSPDTGAGTTASPPASPAAGATPVATPGASPQASPVS